MAKVHLDRLKGKYGDLPITGKRYSNLVSNILVENTDALQKGMERKSKKSFENFSKKFGVKERRLVLPDAKDVIPARAIQVSKAAQSGKLITDTLKDRMTQALRKRLREFPETSYVTRRGVSAGRINPRLIDGFEKDLKEVFQNYTKKDPKFGVPANVRGIAVTEGRRAINVVKNEYTNKMIEANPDLSVKKIWFHYPSLSKVPRRGHGQQNRRTVGFNDLFKVSNYEGNKRKGINLMRFPHDPEAPAEQVINCNCDYDIVVSKRPKNRFK